MTAGPGVLDLRGTFGWSQATIPESAPPVGIVRLHTDLERGSGTSVVRFPPGWERPGSGYYEVDEEIAVLDGELVVSGVSYRALDYGWLPAGMRRSASATPEGALVLAWFSGFAAWVPGDDHRPRTPPRHVPLRGADPGLELRDGVRLVDDPAQVSAPAEILSLDGRWAWVGTGQPLPVLDGTTLMRTPRA